MINLQINHIYTGDAETILRTFPDNSIDCAVTSPPYYGLRDYGVSGQIGLEETPETYIARLVDVFRQIRRVLKPQGTLWLNIGDSYAGSGRGKGDINRKSKLQTDASFAGNSFNKPYHLQGYKHKDLIGIPWQLAFALRADGWYLRQDIIWHKPNPMPESVRDRCTKAHEYIFLLSKSARYYFNHDAMLEPARGFATKEHGTGLPPSRHGANIPLIPAHNKRSVWNIPTRAFKGAHFATFPPALIIDCIRAGCPENGIVLDPFFGAGTTGLVAQQLARNYIGIELNTDYVKIAKDRIKTSARDYRKEDDLF